MSRIIKLIKNRKGQGIVEFALVAPFIFMLILGMIEFGWLLNGRITLNSALREGARVAAVDQTQKLIEDAVINNAKLSGLSINKVTYNILPDDYIENEHNVEVLIEAKMQPLLGLFVDKDGVVWDVSAIMRKE